MLRKTGGLTPTARQIPRRFFRSKTVELIGLLNAILKLALPIIHVEILNPFSYQEFADDRLVVLDIRARDSAGRWLNIEMQVTT
jgi:predicted transposase/invertase (TIGR01784 family)